MSIDDQASSFLSGKALRFADAMALAKRLVTADKIGLARQVLERAHEPDALTGGPMQLAEREAAAQKWALWTSKDPELPAALRHDSALNKLRATFALDQPSTDGNAELLGIAGGICKRRWQDLGQLRDLQRSADYYQRGAKGPLGDDAYAQINAAFVDDLLAGLGDQPELRRKRAQALRQRIVDELTPSSSWFNAASRAEALIGLQRLGEATAVLKHAPGRQEPWELQTTARQLADMARMHASPAGQEAALDDCFRALLPGVADPVAAARAMTIGKVGLALSGGGFRASFYHLGLLARLAESDMLRHVEVLSCVSGGSIVGACWWLLLRERLQNPKPMQRDDYVELVQRLIAHFTLGVAGNPRGKTQDTLGAAWRLLTGAHGALSPERMAEVLDEMFYRPLTQAEFGQRPVRMDELTVKPADHALQSGDDPVPFNPTRHNWLRAHKMPALVINATTVNSGHAWQFTSTWMGESPWSAHADSDSVQRLEWDRYDPPAGWTIPLCRAVAASASVPGVFEPLKLGPVYGSDLDLQLMDGGVFDNQGTAALLAMSCNVLLVSDACGQLLLEPMPSQLGKLGYGVRAMDTLMERVRGASMADLAARKQSGLVRRAMVHHMKSGLVAESRNRAGSQATRSFSLTTLTPSGLRRDFQQALAELRTDLDAFSPQEQQALMACGYQMTHSAIERDLDGEAFLVAAQQTAAQWPFAQVLAEITSTASTTPGRATLLDHLHAGRTPKLLQ